MLRHRDGAICSLCKEPETNLKSGERGREGEAIVLEVEHIDGNHKNNAYKNLRLSCHSCNMTERFRLKKLRSDKSGESEGESKSVSEIEKKLPLFPIPEEGRGRSIKIKTGLLKYLFEVAYKRTPPMTEEQILASAPAWIDQYDPPSDPAMRRWLKMFTTSEYYPWRFDEYGILFMVEAEPIVKEN